MFTNPQERFIDLSDLLAACQTSTDELETGIKEALGGIGDGAGHTATQGILLLLQSLRERQERLKVEMQKLLELGIDN